MRHPAQSLAGPGGARLVRLLRPRPRHRPAAGLRLLPRLGLPGDATTSPRPTRPRRPTRSARSRRTTCPAPARRRHRRRAGRPTAPRSSRASSSYSNLAPIGPNYTETSGARPEPAGHRSPGERRSASRRPALAKPMDVVGSPRLTVQLTAPVGGPHPGGRPGRAAGRLREALRRRAGRRDRAAAPADLAGPRHRRRPSPVTIELPGIVHRFAAGPPARRRPGRRRPGLPRARPRRSRSRSPPAPGLTQQLSRAGRRLIRSGPRVAGGARRSLRTQSTMSVVVAPGVKMCGDAEPLELGDVLVRDDPAAEHDDVVDAALAPSARPGGRTGSCGHRRAPRGRRRRRPPGRRSRRSAPASGAGRCRRPPCPRRAALAPRSWRHGRARRGPAWR